MNAAQAAKCLFVWTRFSSAYCGNCGSCGHNNNNKNSASVISPNQSLEQTANKRVEEMLIGQNVPLFVNFVHDHRGDADCLCVPPLTVTRTHTWQRPNRRPGFRKTQRAIPRPATVKGHCMNSEHDAFLC